MSAHNRLFGTDGIRGIANRYPMTAEVALQVGRAVAHHFRGKGERTDKRSVILIGKDTRRSSYMIEQALAAGVTSQGAHALLVGPMPTPGVSFLTKSMRADAGIMVSASHNTYEYNGIKLFGHDGFKLPDEVEVEIERLVLSTELQDCLPTGSELGRAKRIDDAMGRYVVHAKSVFPQNDDLRGMRIVLDCANGAAYKTAPLVFEELGAEVIVLGNQPDGVNINRDVGALYPHLMAEAVKKYRADLGIALDGDADRLILADGEGQVVDGDQVMAILAADLAERGLLHKNTLVTTPMSNMGLEIALRRRGVTVVQAGIGDRAVVETMVKRGFNLGGEQSGHIIFLDKGTTGDGVVAALSVISVMRRTGKPLSELRNIMTIVPQILRNVKVARKLPLEDLKEVTAAIELAKTTLGDSGRLLVRYSGTEPLCRVMVEGEDAALIAQLADDIVGHIKRVLA
ncbi:MAG: phosphoglucosamine mutase [Bdellovibrionales bacterium]|nr:phosphoglucosamine mutase [Bdellovibrionales bacterium]